MFTTTILKARRKRLWGSCPALLECEKVIDSERFFGTFLFFAQQMLLEDIVKKFIFVPLVRNTILVIVSIFCLQQPENSRRQTKRISLVFISCSPYFFQELLSCIFKIVSSLCCLLDFVVSVSLVPPYCPAKDWNYYIR